MSSVSWTTVPFEQLVVFHDHRRVPLSKVERSKRPGAFPYYGAQGIIDSIDDYIFDGRFLLIAEDGENLRSRKEPIAFIARGKFWVNNHAHVVSAVDNIADVDFLRVYLEFHPLNGYVTGAAQPKLSQSNLKSLPVTVPPFDRQVEIGRRIRAIDGMIDQNWRRIEILEEVTRLLYQEWFVHFRYPGHEEADFVDSDLGPIPRDWEVAPISSVATFSGGNGLTKAAYVPSGYRAFSAAGPDGYLDSFDVEGNGVVLSAVGARCGRTFRATGRWSSIANTIRFVANEGGSSAWLFLATDDPDIWPRRGSAQPFVSINDARALRSVIPPSELRSRFEQTVQSSLDLVDNLELQVEVLREARDLLLPRLVSGELDISDLDLELEAVGV